MSNWHDNHCKAMEKLFKVSCELDYLAEAFSSTGNELMFKDLKNIAAVVYSAQEVASNSIGKLIREIVAD